MGRMNIDRSVAWRALLAAALMFSLAVAGIELTRASGRIAAVWLANGAVLAILLRSRRAQWAPILAASFSANVAATLTVGDTILQGAILSACNLIEVLVVAGVMRRYAPAQGFARSAAIFLFGFASIAGAALAATIAATYLAFAGDWLGVFRTWFIADTLGLLLVTPLVSAWGERSSYRLAPREWAEWGGHAALCAIVAMLIFSSPEPRLFLLMPVLLLAGFRLRPIPASAIACIGAAIAGYATFHGHGPIAAAGKSLTDEVLLLQAFVATGIFLCMPVSGIIGERNRLESTLRSRERQYRVLAENTSDMIVSMSLDGVPSFVSNAAMPLLGFRPDELVCQAPGSSIHPDDREAVAATIAKVAAGSVQDAIRYRKIRRDERPIWVESTYQLVAGEDGLPPQIIASVRDIDRRHQAEELAAQALEEARAAADAKSNFLATMSHEIRTPMTGVLGMIDLLHDDLDPTERRTYLATL